MTVRGGRRLQGRRRRRATEGRFMTMEESGTPSRSARRTRTPPVRITPARARRTAGLEIRRSGDRLEVTFAAPDIPEPRFRYRVGARYLLVWADGARPRHHHFIPLPERVQTAEHEVSFVNGVVDARVRLRVHPRPQSEAI